jgi:hypothetical protein
MKTIEARFATSAEAASHGSFLKSTTLADLQPHKYASPPRRSERWVVSKQWEAMPDFKKWSWWDRWKYSPNAESFRPNFLSWYPLAGSEGIGQSVDWLVSGFGPGNFLAWSVNGSSQSDNTPRAFSEGTISRGYWSTTGDGQYGWFLSVGTRRSLEPTATLWFMNKGTDIPSAQLEWASLAFEGGVSFNPWRPFAREFAAINMVHGRQFDFYKVGSLETSISQSLAASIDLSSLPKDASEVDEWLWHPSGEYLVYRTVVRNPSSKAYSRRLHLLDPKTGQIALSSEPIVDFDVTDFRPRLEGWNPGGQLLALDRAGAHVWDIASNRIRQASTDEQPAVWLRRIRALSNCRSFGDGGASVDGNRNFDYNQSGLQVVSEQTSFSVGPISHAAWSPHDPHCFATVGGPESFANAVRIWRLQN